jgi:hypothetical protein
MRTLLLLVAAAMLLAACNGKESKSGTPAAGQAATTTPPPPAAKVIAVPPCELPLAADQMIPGTFTVKESTLFTAQCVRSWDADLSLIGATQRVAILGRLYQNLTDAKTDFDMSAKGDGAMSVIKGTIQNRGFLPHQIKVTDVNTLPSLGADDQSAFRAEFTRGTPADTWVEYFVFVRVKNTRAQIEVVAQNAAGAEAKGLFDDAQQVAKKQAEHLLAVPANADPVTPTPMRPGPPGIPFVTDPVTRTPSPTPTP